MDLQGLEIRWKEHCIELKEGEKYVYFTDLFSGPRGTKMIGGYMAVQFARKDADADDLFLCVAPTEKNFHCLSWDADRSRWVDMGILHYTNEWGNYQFMMYWDKCAIVLEKSKETIKLCDIFSQCLGERYEGLLFLGAGILEDQRFVLKLDTDTRLSSLLSAQQCLYYDKDAGEWKPYGTLLRAYR
ncbi:hypothetical protein KGO95_03375 [Patescibacteria group bacterium]|nr:hypothetical protein [Patescibacteria group bacterium]